MSDDLRQQDAEARARRLEIIGFVLALASYVALGYVFKSLVLNWLVGPLYLLVVLHLVPAGVRRLRRGPAT